MLVPVLSLLGRPGGQLQRAGLTSPIPNPRRMDPLSHVALGRLLIEPLSARLGRGAIGACVLGSLSPDVDLAIAPRGWDVYLRAHQAGTHALVGRFSVAWPPDRWWASPAAGTFARSRGRCRRQRRPRGPRLDRGSGHPAVLAGFNRPLPWPLFAMADPWLFALLLLSAFLVAAMAPRRLIARVVDAVDWPHRGQGRHAPNREPNRRTSRQPGIHRSRRGGLGIADPLDPLRGRPAVRRAIRHQRAGRLHDAARPRRQESQRSARCPIRVARHRAEPAGVARHHLRLRRAAPCDGGVDVFWSDLRYCAAMPSRGVAYQISDLRCGLWFGGESDERSRARTAVMQVGPVVQRRTPSIPDAAQQ